MQTMTQLLANDLYTEHRQRIYVQTDRLFAVLLAFEWLAGIVTACIVTPQTWAGEASSLHMHVLAATVLGGLIVMLPITLVLLMPGKPITRHTVAIAQMLYSGLFIHLSGGRIESHFHVFGSLAFLAFYRDWRVLLTASTVVGLDHALRGFFWTQSVYGVTVSSGWRTLEHVSWVLFEDIFLIIACIRNQSEMRDIAERQARLETVNEFIETQVQARTADLTKNVNKFRTLCELSPVVIFQADREGQCSFMSQRWRELTGQTFADSMGWGWSEGLHPDDHEMVMNEWTSTVATGSDFSCEYRYVKPDGDTLWMSVQARRIEGDDKGGYVGTANDITARKVTEAATAQLADIVRNTQEAIYSQDLNGLITSWNAAAENLFGYTAEEIIGKHRSVLMINQEQMDQADAFQILMMEGNPSQRVETTRQRKDGSSVQVEITVSGIRERSNKLLGISLIARDVTAKKEAEHRIAEFYSTVSHELRSPLTSIRGALTLINNGVVDANEDEGRELLSIAATSSERLIRLINDILDLRKIEAGAMELHLRELPASEIVRSAVDSMRGMASQADILLDTAILDDAMVMCDQDRLTQVLANYISNAIKFAPAGSTVNVSVACCAGGFLRFSVTDSGSGIPLDKQSKLFEKFQQADSSDTRAKDGTGLGLAISKAIVEQHNGTVGFWSRPSIGSVFWFDLKEFERVSAVPAVSNQQKPTKSQIEKTRILLVEDDEDLSHMLAVGLVGEGYACHQSHSVSQALQHAASSTVDIFILDLNLPDGNAVHLIEMLRQDPKYAMTPVIVITGDNGQNGLPLVFDLLIKPFEQDRLMRTLERAVQQQQHGQRILIVDDDAGTRSVVCSQLRALNLEFDHASNGLEAIRRIEEKRPDMLILDISMPFMDGFGLLEELRRRDSKPLPLIVYSGQDLTATDRERLNSGITKYLTKGIVSEKEFVDSVSQLLAQIREAERTPVVPATSGELVSLNS